MRYTTIIDITELPLQYRNPNFRLLYLHLVLRSGYHDDDRDIIHTSIRRLAWETGLTVDAVRHAISLLEKAGLLTRNGNAWTVTKWVLTKEITSRPKSTREAKNQEVADERSRQQRQLEITYRRRSQEEFSLDFFATFEKFLEQERNGTIGVAGRHYLDSNREKYERMKSELTNSKKDGR